MPSQPNYLTTPLEYPASVTGATLSPITSSFNPGSPTKTEHTATTAGIPKTGITPHTAQEILSTVVGDGEYLLSHG